jgi:purine nucleosidase
MPTPLVLMHDGAVDELVCIPFLMSMAPDVQLTSVWITPADCLAYPTADACGRMLQFIGQPGIPLFLSDSSSERPFPWEYRQYSMMVNLLPILNPQPPVQSPSAQTVSFANPGRSTAMDAFYDNLRSATDAAGTGAIFVVTCPMTDLAALLSRNPGMLGEIREVVWMGGTISAGGNIDTGIAPGANPNAEWNAYWDPASVLAVLQSGLSLTMFPLDITNQTLLGPSTLQQYFLPQAPANTMMNLVSQMYALVAFQGGYSFWDTLTACYIGKPDLFALQSQSVTIDTDPTSATFGQFTTGTGSPVRLCLNFASGSGPANFYEYLVQQLMSVSTTS